MHLSVDVAGTSELNFEAWRALLRSTCGGEPQAIEPNDFVGWMRPRSVHRLTAAALKISPATVHRELKMAKAWLHRELTQDSASA